MGVWSNVKNVFLGNAYDDDDDYEEYAQDKPETAGNESSERYQKADEKSTRSNDTSDSKKQSKVVNIHTITKLSVVLAKPERYEEVAEITNNFREKRTVVLNLEKCNRDIARRILDFLSGVAYSNDGNLKIIATNTYIITPLNVDIQGDLIDELESSGLYI